MLTISYYFLGLAISILLASVCLSWGKRAGQRAEVELDTLRAVSVCLPAGRRVPTDGIAETMYKELSWDEKARWRDARTIWMRWYGRCQEKAIQKQKAMYSWARTLALSALLCLGGVILEADFDQPITISNILAGFKRSVPPAASATAEPRPAQRDSPTAPTRLPQS